MITRDSFELPNFFAKRWEVVPPYDSLHVSDDFGGLRLVSFHFRTIEDQAHFLVRGDGFVCVRP